MRTRSALVHIPSAQQTVIGESASPFQGFMDELLSRQSRSTTTMAGSAVWTSFPLVQAIAEGIWPIMLKISERSNTLLTTETRVDAVQADVNHLINVGLAVTFENAKAAADAFERDVLSQIEVALRRIESKEAQQPQKFWLMPVAQFFAKLIKRTQEYATESLRLYEEFVQHNDFAILEKDASDSLVVYYAQLTEELRGGAEQLQRLRASVREVQTNDLVDYEVIARFKSELEERRRVQRVLARILYRFHNYPVTAAKYVTWVIETGWIPTQLLLAAANLPDQDFIESHNYARAMLAVTRLSPAKLVARVLKRIEKRKVKLSQPDWALLTNLIIRTVPKVKALEPQIRMQTAMKLFLVITDKVSNLTPGDAEDAALMPMGDVDENSLVEKLDWKALDIEKFRAFLSTEEMSPVALATGITRMNKRLSQSAVREFLESGQATASAIERLVEAGLVQLDAKFIEEQPDLVPANQATQLFLGFLEARVHPFRAMVNLLQRMNRDEATPIFSKLENRPALMDLVVEVLSGKEFGVEDLKLVKAKIGVKLYTLFVLACHVSLRAETYKHPEEEEPGSVELPWAEQTSQEMGGLWGEVGLHKQLLISPAELPAILKKYTEDDVFLWLYEANPKRKRLHSAFCKDRARYRRQHEG